MRAWSLGNLVEYWRPWTTQYRNGPSSLDGDDAMVCWGVLGVSRLHYTIHTGRITSKTGAGQHALERFEPRWHRIIAEALRLRAEPAPGSDYMKLSERREEVVAFVTWAIEWTLRAGAA
ncbi:MAG TPA: aminoglycoside adenylyltransferase domain-containing protein [Polyangiaceae bacterium]|nr:aminoglycoside adenylyltransferase domain-containing protein [Polyangiaceae bacterium]